MDGIASQYTAGTVEVMWLLGVVVVGVFNISMSQNLCGISVEPKRVALTLDMELNDSRKSQGERHYTNTYGLSGW